MILAIMIFSIRYYRDIDKVNVIDINIQYRKTTDIATTLIASIFYKFRVHVPERNDPNLYAKLYAVESRLYLFDVQT